MDIDSWYKVKLSPLINGNCLSALDKLTMSLHIEKIIKNNITPSGFKTDFTILSIIISPLRGL